MAPNVVEGPAASLRSLAISLVTNLVPWKAESMSTKPTCLKNNPMPVTPRMRPAIEADLRSFAEADKAYMRQLGSVEIPTRVVILSGVWRVHGAKRSRRTCGFSAKSDNIPCDKSRPVEGREHVNKARQLPELTRQLFQPFWPGSLLQCPASENSRFSWTNENSVQSTVKGDPPGTSDPVRKGYYAEP